MCVAHLGTMVGGHPRLDSIQICRGEALPTPNRSLSIPKYDLTTKWFSITSALCADSRGYVRRYICIATKTRDVEVVLILALSFVHGEADYSFGSTPSYK
jgi:hypothetical protein